VTRWTARLSLAAVALIAAVASYLHALVVVQAADGRGVVAYFIPFLADLVIASAAANILDAGRTGHPRPRWSMAAVGVGIVATLYANVMFGYPERVPSWLVNGWPPVAFALTLESITGMVRRGREVRDSRLADHEPTGTGQDEPPDLEADMRRLLERHSQRSVSRLTGASRARLAQLARPPAPAAAEVQLNGSRPDA